MIDYSSLNPAQKTAVFSDNPRILCLAGAGTGKTQVLTRRVARLSESGIPAGEMLALTFTRAAGAEMKDRVISLIGDDGKNLFCNTFHAFCVNVIRENAQLLGYDSGFSIYTPAEQEKLMTRVLNELKIDLSISVINQARAGRGTLGAAQHKQADIALNEYRSRLHYLNAVDFDGLIEYTRTLLSRTDISVKYRKRYKHIFVDEFQDTDPTQWELVRLIDPDNLFVVGDDFQAIYGFRGSDIKIILSLAENPDWETIKLEMNYRSTIPIIAAANSLIKNNTQTKKILISQKSGDNIEIVEPDCCYTEIMNLIPRLKQNLALGISTAILARTNRQLQTARNILAENGVACTPAAEAANPFMSEEAKSVFDWIDAVENPKDDTAVKQAAATFLTQEEITRIEIEQDKTSNDCFVHCAEISETTRGSMFAEKYYDIVTFFMKCSFVMIPHELIESLSRRLCFENTSALVAAVEAWERTQRQRGENPTLEALREYARISAMIEAPSPKLTADEIHLMTAHGSKGLEFEDVFIIGANQGVFPNRGDIEEERRLFYVAMTRARERLTISSPKTIVNYRGDSKLADKSQFIGEALNP